jgi:hypothetical protein
LLIVQVQLYVAELSVSLQQHPSLSYDGALTVWPETAVAVHAEIVAHAMAVSEVTNAKAPNHVVRESGRCRIASASWLWVPGPQE